jgi:Fibronectin type III domain
VSLSTRTKVKPPSNLSVTYSASGGFAANLRWTPVNSGFPYQEFVVYRDGVEIASGITEGSYRDATVIEGQNYDYQVATVNVNLTEGDPSSAVAVDLPYFPVISTPISMTILQNNAGSLVSYAYDPGSLSYYFAMVGGTAPSQVSVSTDGLVTVGMGDAGAYGLGFRVVNSAGLASSASATLVIQSLLTAPNQPTNLLVNAGSTSALDVSWSAPSSGAAPTGYDVDYSISSSGPWTSWPFSGTGTVTRITGLLVDTLYYVRVRAKNSAGSSAYVSSSGRTDAAPSSANFRIPVSTSARTINFGSTTAYGTTTWLSLSTNGKTIPTDGDVIELAAGTHGRIKIQGVSGSPASRIVIRSSPSGQAIIRASAGTSGGFVLHFSNCEYMEVDGSATTGQTYGIKVMGPASGTCSPSSWVHFDGGSQHYEVHHVDIDGLWPTNSSFGSGFQSNDHALQRSVYPGRFIEDLEFHHNRVRNISGSGWYCGPNFSVGDLPLKNVLIHDNIVDNVGNTGITFKSGWEGTNQIYNNVITNAGSRTSGADQRCGIAVFDGKADVFNNFILDAGAGNPTTATITGVPNGIICGPVQGPYAATAIPGYGTYATFEYLVYNNLVARAADNGIIVRRAANRTVPIPYIYNNTSVNCLGPGIATADTSGGWVRNNIALGNSTNISSVATATNNLTMGITVSACFPGSAADDYHLGAEQAAAGTLGTDISSTDIEGTSRSGTASKGAYEYS